MQKITLLLFIMLSHLVSAGPITCGSTERTATLDSAEICKTGSGNTQGNGSTINAHFTGNPWDGLGSLTNNGSDNYLTSNLTVGSWTGTSVAGEWAVDGNFWNLYDQAVISIHVGNGNGGPDHFAWLISDNATSGSWSYDKLSGGGGGLSNMKLWGRGGSSEISEPSPITLFLLGLFSIGIINRYRKINS